MKDQGRKLRKWQMLSLLKNGKEFQKISVLSEFELRGGRGWGFVLEFHWKMGYRGKITSGTATSSIRIREKSAILELSFSDFIEFMFNRTNLLFRIKHNGNTEIVFNYFSFKWKVLSNNSPSSSFYGVDLLVFHYYSWSLWLSLCAKTTKKKCYPFKVL